MIFKGLLLAIVVLIFVFAVATVLFLFARWVYNTFMRDEAVAKAQLNELLDELRERKKNGEF